jgi:ABC-type nitrate/sulfonate/bicarbonate transport system ATPase subunit
VLVARGLTKRYPNGACVLQDISLELKAGETAVIIGPSGCGKTTLLYMLCGMLSPDAGTVLLHGREVRRRNPETAIILQDFGLLPWRTVLDNVALGLKLRGARKALRAQRSRELLTHMGLAGREQDYPGQLSGGEQQRVAIARALAVEPQLLLMDEPFSSLDAITREKLQATLLETWKARNIPYILVTHSVEEAVLLGQTVVLLAGRPASIVATFRNDGFGTLEYRHHEEYFQMIRAVRREMEHYW